MDGPSSAQRLLPSLFPPGPSGQASKRSKKLAGNEFCPFQMYSIDDHIFSIQGHPEFTRDYTRFRMDNQKANVPGAVYTAAIDSLASETDELTIGKWINNFLN